MSQELFHEGEIEVQARTGETHLARRNARAIASQIPLGAFGFVARQRMAVVGSVGSAGDPWVSVFLGSQGLATASDPHILELDLSLATLSSQDPLWKNIAGDPRVGCLFIELATRRRLRINGRVESRSGSALRIGVEEAYPNCPKYIQRRRETNAADSRPKPTESSRAGRSLTEGQRSWIAQSDTFFVASGHPRRGVDASHRGGPPGFVEVLGEQTLRIPDYLGNSLYNTLGNLAANPRAGLLFVDFERPGALQLTGRTEILWNVDDGGDRSGGTHRYWTFSIERWIERALPPILQWELLDRSPYNPEM